MDPQAVALGCLLLILIAFEVKTSTGEKQTKKIVRETKTINRRV